MGCSDFEPNRKFIKVGKEIICVDYCDVPDIEECCIMLHTVKDNDISKIHFSEYENPKIIELKDWPYGNIGFNPLDFSNYFLNIVEGILEDYLSQKDLKKVMRDFDDELHNR